MNKNGQQDLRPGVSEWSTIVTMCYNYIKKSAALLFTLTHTQNVINLTCTDYAPRE